MEEGREKHFPSSAGIHQTPRNTKVSVQNANPVATIEITLNGVTQSSNCRDSERAWRRNAIDFFRVEWGGGHGNGEHTGNKNRTGAMQKNSKNRKGNEVGLLIGINCSFVSKQRGQIFLV